MYRQAQENVLGALRELFGREPSNNIRQCCKKVNDKTTETELIKLLNEMHIRDIHRFFEIFEKKKKRFNLNKKKNRGCPPARRKSVQKLIHIPIQREETIPFIIQEARDVEPEPEPEIIIVKIDQRGNPRNMSGILYSIYDTDFSLSDKNGIIHITVIQKRDSISKGEFIKRRAKYIKSR